MPNDAFDDPPVILLVDDEPTVLESLRTQLRDRLGDQYEIETATQGAEALELLESLQEDGVELSLIISDEIMPQMRGHKLLAEIHARSPQTRTILLTGQSDTQSIAEAVNRANLFHYISKPWDRMDLLLTVQRALDSYWEESRRLQRMEMFHRFVPADFLEVLEIQDPIHTQAGMGKKQPMAVLFADLRGFTGHSEGLDPSQVLKLLNQIFGLAVPIIQAQGGVVDKFVGDGIMALFPEAEAAAQAAIRMVQETRRLPSALGRLELGVGINWGEVLLGVVGTSSRLQTTVVGDVVNVAARLETFSKALRAPIVLSEACAQSCSLPTRFLGWHPIRGRLESEGLYEVLGAYEPAALTQLLASREAFEGCTQQRDRAQAQAALEQFTLDHPDDAVAESLLAQLRVRSQSKGSERSGVSWVAGSTVI